MKNSTKIYGTERYFFDIPVFRTDIKSWAHEHDESVEKLARKVFKSEKEITDKERTDAEKWLSYDWSAYYYSEMVGMIRLFVSGNQVRGELWFVKQRISKALKNKKWQHIGKLFELSIYATDKNKDIFRQILDRIEKENNDWLLRNRYIDTEAFENAGRHIDYLGLMSLAK